METKEDILVRALGRPQWMMNKRNGGIRSKNGKTESRPYFWKLFLKGLSMGDFLFFGARFGNLVILFRVFMKCILYIFLLCWREIIKERVYKYIKCCICLMLYRFWLDLLDGEPDLKKACDQRHSMWGGLGGYSNI